MESRPLNRSPFPSRFSKRIPSPADAVHRRVAFILIALVALTAGQAAAPAQAPAATTDLKTLITNLGSLDYPTRMNAARLIRRAAPAEAVPALVDAVRRHPDEYVRNRAFIVLSSFNDKGTPDLARSLITDKNDRLRESALKWLEQH